ncbi:MAG: class I SAM-dependent methyltransferase [Bacillota bacterium]
MNKLARGMIGLGQLIKSPGAIKNMLLDGYNEYYAGQRLVPVMAMTDLLGDDVGIKLENFWSKNGNVSSYELMCLSALCANYKPRVVLEIGTFDGNTALQMALNIPPDSMVYTMDLPDGTSSGKLGAETRDLQFIAGDHRENRRYARSAMAHKIKQILADSAEFNFSSLGGIDLAFIDGSHSFAYVKNDTEKILPLLNKGGVIIWHDYTPAWIGVWSYLNGLNQSMKLWNIEGTTLVVHIKKV